MTAGNPARSYTPTLSDEPPRKVMCRGEAEPMTRTATRSGTSRVPIIANKRSP